MFSDSIKHFTLATAIGAAVTVTSPPVLAADTLTLSHASGVSAATPAAVISFGASTVVTGSAVLTVKAVQLSANGTRVVVEGAARGSAATLELIGNHTGSFAAGVGDTLRVVKLASGILLVEAQRAVAWIPNQRGEGMSHHEQLTR